MAWSFLKFPIFELERVQSLYENPVESNLTERGFPPLTLRELLTPAQLETMYDEAFPEHLDHLQVDPAAAPLLREVTAEGVRDAARRYLQDFHFAVLGAPKQLARALFPSR